MRKNDVAPVDAHQAVAIFDEKSRRNLLEILTSKSNLDVTLKMGLTYLAEKGEASPEELLALLKVQTDSYQLNLLLTDIVTGINIHKFDDFVSIMTQVGALTLDSPALALNAQHHPLNQQ